VDIKSRVSLIRYLMDSGVNASVYVNLAQLTKKVPPAMLAGGCIKKELIGFEGDIPPPHEPSNVKFLFGMLPIWACDGEIV
jgi:hypothetical protein